MLLCLILSFRIILSWEKQNLWPGGDKSQNINRFVGNCIIIFINRPVPELKDRLRTIVLAKKTIRLTAQAIPFKVLVLLILFTIVTMTENAYEEYK